MAITMYALGPALSPEQILAFEKEIHTTLPDQYKEFLLQNNGGAPDPHWFKIEWDKNIKINGFKVGGIEYFLSIYSNRPASFSKYYKTFKGRIPEDTIAIGFDAGGNLILLGTGKANQGRIYFWMHSYEVEEGEKPDYSNVGFIANSLNEFLDSLHPEPS